MTLPAQTVGLEEGFRHPSQPARAVDPSPLTTPALTRACRVSCSFQVR